MSNLQTVDYKKIEVIDLINLEETFSSDYWNNEELEKQKIWGKWDTNFEELTSRFKKKGLIEQFNRIVKDNNVNLNNSNITSLASGICLLEAEILRHNPGINYMTCLEFSKHRIFDIAPGIFAKLEIPANKVELRLGSFFETNIEENSQDIVILSQAFHHSNDTSKLLKEISRILKPNGVIIIIGEHYFDEPYILKKYIKHFIKYSINYKNHRDRTSFIPSWRDLFPIDQLKGDHHYNMKQYSKMFSEYDFQSKRYIFKEYENQAFILSRPK